jgi:hypothetical protein
MEKPLYGFLWNNQSCAFDTVLTTMIYLSKNVFDLEAIQIFARSFPVFTEAITKINFHDKLSWERNKNALQNIVYQSQHSLNFPGHLVKGKNTTLDSVWNALFTVNHESASNFCLSYRLVPQCHITDMMQIKLRSLPVVYLDNIDLDSDSFDSLQNLFDEKFNNRVLIKKQCFTCQIKHTPVHSVLVNAPNCLFLVVNLDLIHLRSQIVDNSISVFGIEYELCAVFYVYLNHFMSRFVYFDGFTMIVLEYDGLKNHSVGAAECTEVKLEPKFPCLIEESGFKMSSVVYIKKLK